jgi:glycosyltransferase involved in cell wall biosynthesis
MVRKVVVERRSMRVVHLSTFESSGGAARAAHGLHVGLVAAGVDSRMLVAHRQSADPRVEVANPNPIDARIWRELASHWIDANRTELSNTFFSTGFAGANVARHPLVTSADILNLHWVPGLVDPRELGALFALGKPVVWTLHDEWAYTGGCHYTSGCMQWRSACQSCPQLVHDPHGLVAALFAEKRMHVVRGRPTIVAPSRWLASRAEESAIFRGARIATIPYGVDLETFHPVCRDAGRARLGLSAQDFVVLFSADAAAERRKGFAELSAALAIVQQRVLEREMQDFPLKFAVLGDTAGVDLPAEAIPTGRLFDRAELASVVAASDLYVLPSLEDNLPNGVLEALACGTPTVAFDVGGAPDMLSSAPGSRLVAAGDVAALADAIVCKMFDRSASSSIRTALRKYAATHYSIDRQAGDYRALYQEL